MNDRFPAVVELNRPEEVMEWLRLKDGKGQLCFAEVMRWINEEIIPL